MKEARRIDLPTQYGRLGPLTWIGNDLVDFGWRAVYRMDGTVGEGPGAFSYRFDKVISSSDGRYAILYEQLGTKGLVLREGQIVREINRSFYHAYDYEYPVAIFTWPDGRTAMAHCPDKYCRLEIEDIETGERLVTRQSKSVDIFHSQLQVSPDNRYLVSAGWVWQPWDVTNVFDLNAVIAEPGILDAAWNATSKFDLWETSTAAFYEPDRVVLAGHDDDSETPPPVLFVCDLKTNTFISKVSLEETAGIMMPVGEYVVGFWKYPKLIEVSSGRIVRRWDDLQSGFRNGPLINAQEPKVQIALDPRNKRFAVGNSERITIIELG